LRLPDERQSPLSLLTGGTQPTSDKHCLQGIGKGHEKRASQASHHGGQDLVADPLKDKVLSPGPRGERVGSADGFQEGPIHRDLRQPWIAMDLAIGSESEPWKTGTTHYTKAAFNAFGLS